jgi:regulator of replication initiation timing
MNIVKKLFGDVKALRAELADLQKENAFLNRQIVFQEKVINMNTTHRDELLKFIVELKGFNRWLIEENTKLRIDIQEKGESGK